VARFRDVLIRVEAARGAVAKLKQIRADTLRIEAAVRRDFELRDAASSPINRAAAAVGRASTNMQRASSAAAGTVPPLLKLAATADRAATRSNRAGSSLSTFGASLTRMGPSLTSKLKSLQGGASKVAAIGAAAGFSALAGGEYKQLVGSIQARAATPEAAETYTSWVEEGGDVDYSSRTQRAQAASLMAGSGSVKGSEALQTEFLEELERTIAISGTVNTNAKTLGEASGLLESFISGNAEALNGIIPGYQLSNEKVAELRERYRAAVPELRNASDRQVDLYVGMKESLEMMREANAGLDPAASPAVKLRMALEKMREAYDDASEPYLRKAAAYMTRLSELAEEYPREMEVISYTLAAVSVGSAAAVVVAQMVRTALLVKAGIDRALTVGLRLLKAVVWLFNAVVTCNPLGLAIFAGLLVVAAFLDYLARRFDAVGRAMRLIRGPDGSEEPEVEVEEPKVEVDPTPITDADAEVEVDLDDSERPKFKIVGVALAGIHNSIDNLGVRIDNHLFGIVIRLGEVAAKTGATADTARAVRDELAGWEGRVRAIAEKVVVAVGAALAGALGAPSIVAAGSEAGVEGGEEEEPEVEVVTLWRARPDFAPMILDLYGKTTFSPVEYSGMVQADQDLMEPAKVQQVPVSVAESLGYPDRASTSPPHVGGGEDGGEAVEDRAALVRSFVGFPRLGGGLPGLPGEVLAGLETGILPGEVVTEGEPVPKLDRGGEVLAGLETGILPGEVVTEGEPVPKLDRGGEVLATGRAVIHEGEEISSAGTVRVLDRLVGEVLAAASPPSTPASELKLGFDEVVLADETVIRTIRGPLVYIPTIRDTAGVVDAVGRLRAALADLVSTEAGR
jgi:hypothetical protein